MKAIQTVYKGYKFRSRLEARWAVFFDACGYPWEYEPEGFDLGDGVYYLPDFKICFADENGDFNTFWIEVKPKNKPLSNHDLEKIKKFRAACWDSEKGPLSGYGDFILVEGIPEPRFYKGELMTGINGDEWIFFPSYRGRPFFTETYKNIPMTEPERFSEAIKFFGYKDDITQPYIKARQARFEHGETPL